MVSGTYNILDLKQCLVPVVQYIFEWINEHWNLAFAFGFWIWIWVNSICSPWLRHQYLVCFTSARFTGVSWILSVCREYFSCLDTNTALRMVGSYLWFHNDSKKFRAISAHQCVSLSLNKLPRIKTIAMHMQITAFLVTMATHWLSCPPHPVYNQHRATGLVRPDKLKQWRFLALRARFLLIQSGQNCVLLSSWPCLAFRKKVPTMVYLTTYSQLSSSFSESQSVDQFGEEIKLFGCRKLLIVYLDQNIPVLASLRGRGGWAGKSHAKGSALCLSTCTWSTSHRILNSG